MKQHSKAQIEAFCKKLWAEDDSEIEVVVKDYVVIIEVKQMYSHVDHGFKVLNAISQYFGTQNIESSLWHSHGCDTCDYGSSHTVELTISPDPEEAQ